jgi:xylonate dehydratase
VKATAIDSSLLDANGIYQHEGPARVFVNEKDAMAAIKQNRVQAGDVLVLAGVGPMGTGMEETYQVTGALKYLPHGRQVALLTDARFSGVSTGACIGHIGPEGLAGGPIGKILDGDVIRIVIDRNKIEGSVDFVGEGGQRFSSEEGARRLAQRATRKDLAPNAALPDDTKLWAALQAASGGTWAGCVYDAGRIVERLGATNGK